jgi:hypothetical protein
LCPKIQKIFSSLSSSRVKETYPASRLEIEYIIKEAENEKRGGIWVEKAKEALEAAKKAINDGETEQAWRLLNQAELFAVYGYNKDRLMSSAVATLNEADVKLKDWRKKTLQNTLSADICTASVSHDDLFYARGILVEHHNNGHLKSNLFQNQITILGIIAVMCLGACVIFMPYLSTGITIQNIYFLLVVLAFGALGGCVSGIFSIGKEEKKIPDMLLNHWLTIIRPVIGAVNALAIIVFLTSGLLSMGTLTRELLLAAAFLSGISERWVLSVKPPGETSEGQKIDSTT